MYIDDIAILKPFPSAKIFKVFEQLVFYSWLFCTIRSIYQHIWTPPMSVLSLSASLPIWRVTYQLETFASVDGTKYLGVISDKNLK